MILYNIMLHLDEIMSEHISDTINQLYSYQQLNETDKHATLVNISLTNYYFMMPSNAGILDGQQHTLEDLENKLLSNNELHVAGLCLAQDGFAMRKAILCLQSHAHCKSWDVTPKKTQILHCEDLNVCRAGPKKRLPFESSDDR